MPTSSTSLRHLAGLTAGLVCVALVYGLIRSSVVQSAARGLESIGVTHEAARRHAPYAAALAQHLSELEGTTAPLDMPRLISVGTCSLPDDELAMLHDLSFALARRDRAICRSLARRDPHYAPEVLSAMGSESDATLAAYWHIVEHALDLALTSPSPPSENARATLLSHLTELTNSSDAEVARSVVSYQEESDPCAALVALENAATRLAPEERARLYRELALFGEQL